MMAMAAAIDRQSERGMTLFAVLAVMTIFALGLLAVAPTVQQEVQRDKELEAIRRGEEVAEAIRQFVLNYQGNRLPTSIDELLDGLPRGTRTRQILRPSAAKDPLSEDGRWRLVQADADSLAPFARRVQNFNGGVLPAERDRVFDRYKIVLVNTIASSLDSDDESDEELDDFDIMTENTPFIGVASQSRERSFITYYGIGNHSRWIFTPMFRGIGRNYGNPVAPVRPPTAPPPPRIR